MTDRGFILPGPKEQGVLLIHGLTGAPGEMQFLARRLNKRGFTVHVPQLAGHGEGVGALLNTSWRDWLASAQTALDRLCAEVDSVYVAGICMGGALGLTLAANDKRIKRAAIYSMTFEYDGWNMRGWYKLAPLMALTRVLRPLRRLRFTEQSPYGIRDARLRAMLERDPDAFIDGALSFVPLGALDEWRQLARHLERRDRPATPPTLIIHAENDDMSHPRNAHRLARALSGPVEMMLLKGSYHMVHVDLERNIVADETARFFTATPGISAHHQEPAGASC